MKNTGIVKAVQDNLVRIRKERGLTQSELARKINSSQRAIAYYENEGNNIPLSKVQELAEALEVSVAELLDLNTRKTGIEDIDIRLVKKIQAIETLPRRAKDALWHTINMTLEMQKLKSSSNSESESQNDEPFQ